MLIIQQFGVSVKGAIDVFNALVKEEYHIILLSRTLLNQMHL
jgi:hypothetical protein